MNEEAHMDPDDAEKDLGPVIAHISQALAEGRSQESIVNDIVDEDADEDTRHNVSELVFEVANAAAAHQNYADEQASASLGWLWWIGGLILVNILSSAFDWGFWVY